VCKHYCDTVNSNIELFLKDKARSMELWLESAEEDFSEFWERIGAEGDLSASLEEWTRSYNASDPKEAPDKQFEPPPLSVRAARKAVRIARKFPDFIRKA